MTSVRLFVGCAPDGQDAEFQMALEHSVRSQSSLPVEITWMRLSRDPASPFYSEILELCDPLGVLAPEDRERVLGEPEVNGWDTRDWTTPFTPFRFIVPWLCEFTGRAIYSDSDVIFLADIAGLWSAPMRPHKVFMSKTPRRTCVTLWDCERAEDLLSQPRDMLAGSKGPWRDHWKSIRDDLWQPFPSGENWNCIDGEGMPINDTIKAVHFSDIATQPHLLSRNRTLMPHWYNGEVKRHQRRDLVDSFKRELAAARAAGYDESMYRQEPPFGPVPMADLSGYRDGKL